MWKAGRTSDGPRDVVKLGNGRAVVAELADAPA